MDAFSREHGRTDNLDQRHQRRHRRTDARLVEYVICKSVNRRAALLISPQARTAPLHGLAHKFRKFAVTSQIHPQPLK